MICKTLTLFFFLTLLICACDKGHGWLFGRHEEKVHDEPNTLKICPHSRKEVGCGDTGWPGKAFQSQGHPWQ